MMHYVATLGFIIFNIILFFLCIFNTVSKQQQKNTVKKRREKCMLKKKFHRQAKYIYSKKLIINHLPFVYTIF